jgi:hypothetical protein
MSNVLVPNNLEASQSGDVLNPAIQIAGRPHEGGPDVDLAVWISRLAARGISVRMRNGRVCIEPWRALNAEEQATLRAHHQEIKSLIRGGKYAAPTSQPTPTSRDAGPLPLSATAETAASEAVVLAPQPMCKFCGRACIGPDDPRFEVLHVADPEEVARRDEYATKVMLRQMYIASPHL